MDWGSVYLIIMNKSKQKNSSRLGNFLATSILSCIPHDKGLLHSQKCLQIWLHCLSVHIGKPHWCSDLDQAPLQHSLVVFALSFLSVHNKVLVKTHFLWYFSITLFSPAWFWLATQVSVSRLRLKIKIMSCLRLNFGHVVSYQLSGLQHYTPRQNKATP